MIEAERQNDFRKTVLARPLASCYKGVDVPHNFMRARKQHWGFTLIRVVGGDCHHRHFAAMLLPALARAKARQKGPNASNNQRQLAATWVMYAPTIAICSCPMASRTAQTTTKLWIQGVFIM